MAQKQTRSKQIADNRAYPRRERQLLMHKREILRLFGKIKQDGLTLIPLNLHWSGSNVKVQIGLCKGKKLYDKRQSAAKRQIDRTMKYYELEEN